MRKLLPLFFVFGLVLSACGNNDDNGTTSNPTTTTADPSMGICLEGTPEEECADTPEEEIPGQPAGTCLEGTPPEECNDTPGAPMGDELPAPEMATPTEGAINVKPHAWETFIPVDGSDTEFVVGFWHGVEPCYLVADLQVTETDSTIEVALFTGNTPDDVACIDMAVYKGIKITLDAPIGNRSVEDPAKPIS